MITNGTGGNKRCEFWGIDLATSRSPERAKCPAARATVSGISAERKEALHLRRGL